MGDIKGPSSTNGVSTASDNMSQENFTSGIDVNLTCQATLKKLEKGPHNLEKIIIPENIKKKYGQFGRAWGSGGH